MEPTLPENSAQADAEYCEDHSEMSESEAVKEIFALQHKELDTRKQEIECNKHESDNNRAVAEQSIKAQLEDNKVRAEYFNKKDSRKTKLMGGCLISVLTFLLLSMYMGQTDFAYDIVKIIVGAVAGYFIGKNHQNTDNRTDD